MEAVNTYVEELTGWFEGLKIWKNGKSPIIDELQTNYDSVYGAVTQTIPERFTTIETTLNDVYDRTRNYNMGIILVSAGDGNYVGLSLPHLMYWIDDDLGIPINSIYASPEGVLSANWSDLTDPDGARKSVNNKTGQKYQEKTYPTAIVPLIKASG